MPDNELEAQLAAISVVKSVELMDTVTDSRELNYLTNQVLDSVNRVNAVKTLLENKEDKEISPEDAVDIDHQLSELKVVEIDGDGIIFNAERVQGAEHFSRTLRPKDYRLTRIAACESFLSEAITTARNFTKQLIQNFANAYTLAVEDTESLIQRFKLIDKAVNELKPFNDGIEQFNLSPRLFNLLKVNNSVKEDWTNQIDNLSKTTIALTSNYYDYAEKELTQIMAYFGQFEGQTEETKITGMLLQSGSLLNTRPFPECKIDISDRKTDWLTSRRSVELMGGRYLIDTRWTTPLKIDSTKTIDDWFDSRIKDLGTRLNPRDGIQFTDKEQLIKTFGTKTISHICQTAIRILERWLAICSKVNKHRIGERDYEYIDQALNELPVDNVMKTRLRNMYSTLVRKNQQDLLNICSDFTRYLVITLNAIASLCNDSINFAQSVG